MERSAMVPRRACPECGGEWVIRRERVVPLGLVATVLGAAAFGVVVLWASRPVGPEAARLFVNAETILMGASAAGALWRAPRASCAACGRRRA